MKSKLIGCAIFALSASFAARGTDNLQDLLARMNDAADKFRAMSAKVRYSTYVKVIDDTSVETGTLKMMKVRPNQLAGRIDFVTPDERIVYFHERKAEIYEPKAKLLQIYDLGEHGEQLDRFLMIGFGTSGKELAQDYAMKVLGTDIVDGKSSTRLELTPKVADIQKVVVKLELWIPDAPAQPYPLQEKIYQPGGDYRLVNYSDLQINPNLPANALELKPPRGFKTEYPQKAQ
jgi:outer membrane lipoprotein-sorting protein